MWKLNETCLIWTKTGLKNETGVYTLYFAKKTDLANLNTDVQKSDIDKLKNVPSR